MRNDDSRLPDELSGINNELVNLQRELAKKNAELRQAHDQLEMRVRERTWELQQAREEAERAAAAVSVELAAHRRTEESLRHAQEMLQLVMNHIPQAIFWKDRRSLYLGCNNLLAVSAGYDSPADLVGKTNYDLPWAEQAPAYEAEDAFVMETDTPLLNVEALGAKADGSRVWVRSNKIPLHASDGSVVGVLGSYEDITEQKEAEAALREAKEEAERANAVKSEFLSRMSHELRTPLNSILGFAQIMEMDDPSNTQAQRIAHITKAGQRLLQLIDEILDMTFAESMRRRPPPKAASQKEEQDGREMESLE